MGLSLSHSQVVVLYDEVTFRCLRESTAASHKSSLAVSSRTKGEWWYLSCSWWFPSSQKRRIRSDQKSVEEEKREKENSYSHDLILHKVALVHFHLVNTNKLTVSLSLSLLLLYHFLSLSWSCFMFVHVISSHFTKRTRILYSIYLFLFQWTGKYSQHDSLVKLTWEKS